MKKMVGVMPLWDDEKQSIWMLPGYLDGLKAAGLDSIIFPLTGCFSPLSIPLSRVLRSPTGFTITWTISSVTLLVIWLRTDLTRAHIV